jgi:hypothetical protein
MKIKTIKKVVIGKMEDWLDSITDEKLRSKVRKNLLVSGGSITSMLLKEPVNDYDIYIQDMEVLLELANYYCGDVLDGRKREEYLKNYKPDIFANKGIIPYGENMGEKYVSEQWVRYSNLKPDQVKLNIGGAGIRKEYPEDDKTKYRVEFLSQNAISLSDDIQIVLRFNGNVEQIHKTFDFIHATNYFTFEEGLILNQKALESILTKELKYQGSLYPLTSIIRMKKFLLRGWSMNAGEMLKIMFQIAELDLTDIEVLEEQLIGVDVAYFATLIEALRNVDPKKITPSYMSAMIDKIFNEV